jgi:FMN phosphatase YigB (HAD superfamily)
MNRESAGIDMVLFDMDGVLAHLDFAKRLVALERLTGIRGASIHASIYTSGFERDAEAGAYPTGDEYLAEYNRRIGASLTRGQWIDARREAMTVIEETLAIARQLKGGVRLATLTNNGSLLKEAIAEILPPAAEIFGASFHASYEFNARKPEPQVFTRLAQRYGIPAERILFIDDMPAYLDGARAAGLATIHFTSASALRAQLEARGLPLRV